MSYVQNPENIGKRTTVCDSATVRGSATVCDSAVVCDSATVRDSATVCGSATVCDSAVVCDSATVRDSATVCDSATVRGNGLIQHTRDYIVLGPAISSWRFTTAHRDSKIGVRINCGCFTGTLAEFKASIERTHKDHGPALEQYRCFAALIEAHFALADWQDQIERVTP